ncbi:MAG: hypothetical protein R2824_33920 [Saprospiraceae bacterium]
MIKHSFWLVLCLFMSANLLAQCEVAFDEIDDFDSLRTVSSHPVSFGYMIPSLFETVSGPKLIEEGKALVMYSQNDSINSFFLTLAIPEYTYRSIKPGNNVLMKLSDGEVISFYDIPDKGVFDEGTNMRIYQHTIVLPIDMYYRLTFSTIEAIRIEYKKVKRTFRLTEEQQMAIREAMQCVGRQVELYPVKP